MVGGDRMVGPLGKSFLLKFYVLLQVDISMWKKVKTWTKIDFWFLYLFRCISKRYFSAEVVLGIRWNSP